MICMKRSIAVVALALAMIACAVVVTDESDAVVIDDFEYSTAFDTATVHSYLGTETTVVIPSEITSGSRIYTIIGIDGGAFADTDVVDVTIPESVQTIGGEAFRSCEDLKYVQINGSVSISDDAFVSCSNLLLIDFQENPSGIVEGSFNISDEAQCSYRAPEQIPVEMDSSISSLNYIEPIKKIIKIETIGEVPDTALNLGFLALNVGDSIELPTGASKHGYDYVVLNGETELDLETFVVEDDIAITLSYTYSLFDVIFYVDDEVYEPYQLRYNDVITLPEPPTKETDAQFSYKFKEWSGYTEGMTVTGDMRFDAVFDTTLQTYTVQFVSDGQIVQSKVMGYGETIVPPEDPVRNTEDGIDYRFTGWGGYSSGMTVTGDITFDAVFIESDHEYTIKFVVDGVTVKEDKLLFEEAIVPPEDPVKENANGIKFTFAGWEGYTEGMTVTDDMTFTATFTESPVEEGSSNTWIIVVVVVIVVVFVGLFLFRKFH